MRNKRKWKIIVAGSSAFLFLLLGYGVSSTVSDDEKAQSEIYVIEGEVRILNHPTLGNAVGSNTYLVFQRVDCRKCIIATWTNIDGKYKILAGRGEYRLIVRTGTREGETRDMLSPKQQRFVNADGVARTVRFDIEIVLPKP